MAYVQPIPHDIKEAVSEARDQLGRTPREMSLARCRVLLQWLVEHFEAEIKQTPTKQEKRANERGSGSEQGDKLKDLLEGL